MKYKRSKKDFNNNNNNNNNNNSGKVVPVFFNSALRHEGVLRSRGIAPHIL
jgi:hypothetical protein